LDTVCLITDDFRFSYEIIANLKAERIPFTALLKEDPIPLLARIIVTTEREAPEFGPDKYVIYPTGTHGIEFVVARIKNYLKNITQIETMVMGIDPGRQVGMVLLVNDILVEYRTFTIEVFPRAAEGLLSAFENHEIIVRIGAGANRYLALVLATLGDLAQRYDILTELVDESHTTKGHEVFSKFKLTPHELAALHISMRSGEPVDLTRPISPATSYKKGELTAVQEQSRFASNGMITISRRLARKVLEGELSLHQALEIQLQKNQQE
jgi:hypothetical protein